MVASNSDQSRLFTGIAFRREEQVTRFEDAWFAGSRPTIEGFLPNSDDPLRSEVLLELVLVDLECRLKAGEAIRAETYLERYAEIADNPCRLIALLAHEYQIRRQQEAVTIDEYSARFPLYTDALRAKLATDGEPPAQTVAQQNSAPQFVRRFELVEMVGRGAFGTVWRARDTELDRFVAVKIPSAGRLISVSEEDRFLREARSMAQLRHPSIVTVYEAGRSDGVPFIVAEFIEGVTLAESLTEHRWSTRESAELIRRISRALDYAHQHEIVHRDLKPSNIMLDVQATHGSSSQISYSAVPMELEYEPRVMDFGLALMKLDEATMTVDGQIVGTAAYMSPEQARGESHHVDRRGDVYSTGVILYEMLTGEPPFRGNIRMVLQQVLEEEPRPLRRINDQVPLDLETICLKCLEKEPGSRYQSAGELADELQRFLTGRPILARPVGHAERAWRWCRRHPAVSSLTAAVITMMALGFAGVSWQWLATKRAEKSRTLAQVDALLRAAPDAVPALLSGLEPYRAEMTPVLKDILSDTKAPSNKQLRARLGLLAEDESQAAALFKPLFEVDVRTFLLIRQQLLSCKVRFEEPMRQILVDPALDANRRFRAACYLAASDDVLQTTWVEHAGFVGEHLINCVLANPSDYPDLLEVFRPVSKEVAGELQKVYGNSTQPESARHVATSLLVEYLRHDPVALAELILVAEPWQMEMVTAAVDDPARDELVTRLRTYVKRVAEPSLTSDSLDKLAKERANAAVALIVLGDPAPVWSLLGATEDASARSYFIDRFSRSGGNIASVAPRLKGDSAAERQALVLALGGYSAETIDSDQLAGLKHSLLALFESDPDPGVHAAVRWLLNQWRLRDTLFAAEESLVQKSAGPMIEPSPWYVDPFGQTMIVLGPATYRMGSPANETGRYQEEQQRTVSIDHKFAIAATETTISNYRKFDREWQPTGSNRKEEEDCPIHSISWNEAAKYCNWLSERAGLAPGQWCYVPDPARQGNMREADDCLTLAGYRLPTEAEWEYACRAGTTTARFFGHSAELLPHYAWCPENSPKGDKHPVGRKMPNGFGLFDMYGNADEICHDRPHDPATGLVANYMVTRGGAAGDLEPPRSALRNLAFSDPDNPKQGSLAIGFRVARTIFVPADEAPRQSPTPQATE